ncbi:MAG: FAD binding domain-containing protein [Actinomycetes bacterium]
MQVPASFEYERAHSVAETISLLARHGPEARVVAGGHSLLPMMKLRLAQPEVLIDINGIAELAYLRVEAGELRIGAMTRHADLLGSDLVARNFPILTDAERVIADPIVRNRGTVGGSLCQADPSEDLAAAFVATQATVVLVGAEGTRVVPVSEFHTGPYETVAGPAEILTEVRLPIRAGAGSAYEKVERRAGDWAVAAAGAAVWLQDGVATDVGIGLAAVGAEHFRATEAETALRGRPLDEAAIDEAAAIAGRNAHPSTDQRGPAEYKRHLVTELTARALRRAGARARAQEA